MTLPPNEVISELSRAYLHAVASKATFACQWADRQMDNAGIDAKIIWREKLDPRSTHTGDDVGIQLKATTKEPALEDGRYSYFLDDLKRYNQFRTRSSHFPVLLVVLFLPDDPSRWLELTPDHLLARRCAYWESLWDAPATTNKTGVTVKLPQSHILTPDNLRDAIRRLSMGEELVYGG